IVLLASFQNQQKEDNEDMETNGSCSVKGGDLSDKGKKTFEQNAKGGALEGKAEDLQKIAKKHDVPPTLFVAIVSSESQWGKGANATKQKNPLSVMGAGTIHDSAYPTIDKGLEAGAKNLNELYISEGLTTPEKIGPKYAPTEGATNDPDGMNNAWIPTVKSIMKDLGGEKAKTSCSDSKGSDGKGFDFKGKFPKPDKSKYNGQSYPWGQCTWYVHQRRKEIGKPVPLTWGNGGDWGDNAKAQGWNVGSKPKAGAGASIKPGNFGAPPPYGHIMFVEKVKDDGGIIVSEANVKGEGVISSREFSKADTQKMQFIYDK
ncbi:CHAP domain-containing protein, partial [Staphylococcus aureus]